MCATMNRCSISSHGCATVRSTVAAILMVVSGTTGAAHGQSYVSSELARPPGFAHSRVGGTNNLGQAVGYVFNPVSFAKEAVIWDLNAPALPPVSLGVPPHSWGVPDLGASNINDFGEVIGVGKGVSSQPLAGKGAFHWSASTGFTHLKPINTSAWHSWQQSPCTINCAGNIVGSDVLFGTFATGPVGLHWRPPTYGPAIHSPPGGIQVYGFVALRLMANNDLDEVVGSFATTQYYAPDWFADAGHAFFWNSLDGYVTLSGGAFSGNANDINNCAQVVGSVRYSLSGPTEPVLWERQPDGTFTGLLLDQLSPLPAHGGNVLALSDADQAVGIAHAPNGAWRPVVWDLASGAVTDLAPFLPAHDPTLYASYDVPADINNLGQIVVTRYEVATSLGPVRTTAFVLAPSVVPTLHCGPVACQPGGIAFDLLPPLLVSSGPLYHVLQVTVHGATPGSTVRIVDDSIGRYRQMIATFCPSTPAPAASTLLGSTIADSAGNASILLRLPVSAPGTSTDLLAVEVNSCAHDIEVFTHP